MDIITPPNQASGSSGTCSYICGLNAPTKAACVNNKLGLYENRMIQDKNYQQLAEDYRKAFKENDEDGKTRIADLMTIYRRSKPAEAPRIRMPPIGIPPPKSPTSLRRRLTGQEIIDR